MHQAGATSEDSISAIEPINTSSSNRGDIVRHLHLEQNASPNFTERVWLNQQKLTAELKPHYDFIVCGSGSSGSVVARRLAENPDVSVLLLEAGGCDDVPSVTESVKWFENLGTERDWGFVSQPNQNLKGRSIPLNMGKVLGGGSSINGMGWARGHKNDWDFFASESGDTAWDYESVLKNNDHFIFPDNALGLAFTDKTRLTEFFQKSRELFPDMVLTVTSTFDSGDHAIAEWKLLATETMPYGSGSMHFRRPFSLLGVSVVEIKDAQVIHWSHYYDLATSRRMGLAAFFEEWIEY